MKSSEFQLRGVEDPRLAAHATSSLPAWLWSIDGARILWANPVGAAVFGAADSTALAGKIFGPADPHRRQVARLAGRLLPNGAIRLERLRGFGAPLGLLITCGCARLEFPDGIPAVLVAAAQASGRGMPLAERLRRLVEGAATPMAAFAPDGPLVGASESARALPGFGDLSEPGLDHARRAALVQGRVELPIGIGHMVLYRVGSGRDIGVVALIAPGATQAAHAARHVTPAEPEPLSIGPMPDEASGPVTPPGERPLPDYERPAISGEAPAEFALIDEFAEPLDEPAPAPLSADTRAAEAEAAHEPSPYVESVADEPATPDEARPPAVAPAGPTPTSRRHPLRFMWQMDADGHFTLGSDEFTRLMGARTAARFGRTWREIAVAFGLDPDGRIASAIAARSTWAGITVDWPVDGGERLPVELSGLPVYDSVRNFAGYKGFGVCRDLDRISRLQRLRDLELLGEPGNAKPAGRDETAAEAAKTDSEMTDSEVNASPTDWEEQVETPPNVVPFRPLNEPKSPTLTPIENNAFNELARQLSERLEREQSDAGTEPAPEESVFAAQASVPLAAEPAREQPEWMAEPEPEPPAQGASLRDRELLDLLPTGILIYRLDRLLYANAAFLSRMGYPSLHALEAAGGLDALYVEPGVSSASSTSEAGTPVTITASDAQALSAATEARLHAISWDDEPALALICSPPQQQAAAAAEPAPPAAEARAADDTASAGHAHAEDLAAILDTTAEGVLMFDAGGNIHACNRSAEALFGYDGEELARQNISSLFAPESQRAIQDYLASIKDQDIASLLDPGREVLGRESKGGIIPLSMTMGRTRADSPNFFAVFRDLSQSRKNESEVRQQRLAERAANAKADMLARISHEVRTPLNAIIGFAEVMIGERFGALGNERYVEYMKDIRASGQRVISIINDLLELSRIETGKLDLVFADQNLNELVESCVTVMQPLANRERIIIRTSLAHGLPTIVADASALRQIAMNLIGISIRLADAGGQVIVSTALTDRGEVALRIRDTGQGLSDKEVAAALEPFRTPPPSDQASDRAGLSLSLTKALVEANRAQFNIKSAAHSGTLTEVVFSPTLARA
jgi:PAS domain S-box-containing protein